MRNFYAGEIVTISPTMILPKERVERMSLETDTVIQNYCIASADVSSIVLFPFGLSGMANHARAGHANMEMEWHWWSEEEKEKKMSASAEDLSSAAFAQLDIAFRATVDIWEGTELTFDYGDEWADAWVSYLGQMNLWLISRALNEHAKYDDELFSADLIDLVMPEFRAFMAAPEGFFLPQWHDKPGLPPTQEGPVESESEYLVQDHSNQTTSVVDSMQEVDVDTLGTVSHVLSGSLESYLDDITR
jgi:hypothetical protein